MTRSDKLSHFGRIQGRRLDPSAILFAAAAAILFLSACTRDQQPSFTIATTTSVDNSGLLRHLADAFESETGIVPRWLAVGSGKAIQLASEGKVDLVISHDPKREREFVQAGNAAYYRSFARNDFVLIGPESNPAAVALDDSAANAFRKIASSRSRFASRGDSSGTHARELEIWKEAGILPQPGEGYIQLGQSMSALLRSARELEAYALTDHATFRQIGDLDRQRVVLEEDPLFRNIYSVIVPNSGTGADRKARAYRFAEWLVSDSGRRAIMAFRVRGEQAFIPLQSPP